MSGDVGFTRVRSFAVTALLWGGLLLCGVALQRHWHESSKLLEVLGWRGGVIFGMTFVIMWILAIASWRRVVAAYSVQAIPWSAAARHLTLLLLGKYIPGGVWGFLARLSASAAYGTPRSMAAAGITEQWIGLAMVSLLGAVSLLAAYLESALLMLSALLFPLVVVGSLRVVASMLRRFLGYLPSRWRPVAHSITALHPDRKMLSAAVLTMCQIILSLGLVAAVANGAFDLDPHTTLAVAGSYGLGIMAGILAIFMPGGILVREAIFVLLCREWITPAEAISLAGGLRLMFTAFDLSAGIAGACLQLRGRGHA